MPTERFINLPEEKKKKIQQAAFAEFSRVPMEKVSINKIIQAADISRGSFYTYFIDKTDLLNYILSDLRITAKDSLINSLKENHGNFFTGLDKIMEEMLYNPQLSNSGFFKNLMAGMTLSDDFTQRLTGFTSPDKNCDELGLQLYELSDQTGWELQGYEDFHDFLEIITALAVSTFAKTLLFSTPPDIALNHFRKKLHIIKNGVYSH